MKTKKKSMEAAFENCSLEVLTNFNTISEPPAPFSMNLLNFLDEMLPKSTFSVFYTHCLTLNKPRFRGNIHFLPRKNTKLHSRQLKFEPEPPLRRITAATLHFHPKCLKILVSGYGPASIFGARNVAQMELN
jgi:hypothetical protein